LIQLKEFSGGDNTELFEEERETEAAARRAAERERARQVGGLLRPAELEEPDEEL
jgi:exportin-1